MDKLNKAVVFYRKFGFNALLFKIFASTFGRMDQARQSPIPTNHTRPGQSNRTDKLLSRINHKIQTGIEIGPLNAPIISKQASPGRIKYVDYAPKEILKQVYDKNSYVSIDEIVDVDFIWGDQSLPELVGRSKYNYVIASHVIEHIPDMLGWMHEISEVLVDGGILSLAIPDKRYTFDYFREVSTPGKIIDAYLRHARKPGAQDLFDYFGLTGPVDHIKLWDGSFDIKQFKPTLTLHETMELIEKTLAESNYRDAHVNVFTPASFLNLIKIFSQLNLVDFSIVDFYDTAYHTIEFFISFERLPGDLTCEAKLARQLKAIETAQARLH